MNLVTGGLGFIGSAVVRQLLNRGEQVRIVDSADGDAPPECELIRGDVGDPDVCRRAFDGVTTCFHLAARIGGIGYFHRYPGEILDENNGMLSQVFRTARDRGTKVVYVSSSMVFERVNEFPTPEDALERCPAPFSAYGFSKLVGEWYCHAFNEQFGLPFAIARPFNAYGPGELAQSEPGLAHVIPDLIRKVAAGSGPIALLGNGSQTRSFTYVDDVASAITVIGTSNAAHGEDFNIGTGVETSVRDLLGLLWKLCGRTGEPTIEVQESLPVDVQRRVPEVRKLKDRLGWTAGMPLTEGLQRTIEWHQSRVDRVTPA